MEGEQDFSPMEELPAFGGWQPEWTGMVDGSKMDVERRFPASRLKAKASQEEASQTM
jgi:hypothetical protein